MNKFKLFCLAASLSFFNTGFAQECQTLRVGGTTGWFPITYKNQETQKAEGIANDLIVIIGERLGLPVDIDMNLPWKRILSNLTTGRLDLISAIYWTNEREKLYLYTIDYYTNEARVFVPKGKEFSFNRLEDLIGLTGGIPHGGSFGEHFDTFAKEHSLKFERSQAKQQLVKQLLMERTDYFIQDYVDATMYLKQNDLDDKVVALPHPVSTTTVHFAVSRQSPCLQLVPQINAIIDNAKQDGTLQTIIDNYIK